MTQTTKISGHIVDVPGERTFDGSLTIAGGRIAAVDEHPVSEGPFILPGFVDAHIHIESSMMPPASYPNVIEQQGHTSFAAAAALAAIAGAAAGATAMLTKNLGKSAAEAPQPKGE